MRRTSRISERTLAHLQWAADDIQAFLNEFGPTEHGETRFAEIGPTGEFIRVLNMPLPDGYQPDYCDLLLVVTDYPVRPPIGLYLLNKDAAVVRQMQAHFNAFRDVAWHGADAIRGYTWICYHYSNNTWRYRPDAPAEGDNLRKFLAGFFAELNVRR